MITLIQNSSSFTPMVPPSPDILIPRSVRFGLYVFILPCSLLSTLFLLYHLLKKKKHRQALHNYPLIFLLLPGYSRFQSPSICLIWIFIELWCYAASSLLLTWASFERHILIFHHQWMSKNRYNKILFHYFPLLILFLYLSMYYLVVILFPSCSTMFDYNSQLCGFFLCIFISLYSIALWDAMVHNTIPALLISFFQFTLVIRAVWQKYQLHQPVPWQIYRKMTIQLLIISVCYLFIHFPMTLNICLLLTGSKDLIIIAMEPYLTYLSCYVILLIPFLCLASTWNDIKPRHRRRKIEPFNGNDMNIDQQRKLARMIQ